MGLAGDVRGIRRGVRSLLITEVVLSMVWGFLGKVVPSGGTPMAVLNITMLILSLVLWLLMAHGIMLLWFTPSLWAGYEEARLMRRFSPYISGILSGVVWFLIFGVLRGFLF